MRDDALAGGSFEVRACRAFFRTTINGLPRQFAGFST
jgi:hypothetical protein